MASKNVEICKKYLTVTGVAYNKKALPDQTLSHLEIQEWVWDFRAYPSDPEHGKVTDRMIVEIEPVSTTAKKERRAMD